MFITFAALIVIWGIGGTASFAAIDSAAPVPTLLSSLSPDATLRRNVDFWIRIYTQYTTSQGLIHDAKYVDLTYEVLDFSNSTSSSKNHRIRERKNAYKKILMSLHHKGGKTGEIDQSKLNDEEKRVYALFAPVNEPDKFLNAAHRKRLRFQLGQKDRFLSGLIQSGRYLPAMEEIFKREGIPAELTRLPFVESSFNTLARSKVGASGIWQFMRSTGKTFLKVNDTVDDRNDPIRATEAAAKLLKVNYDSLKNWPLAVTAYNHGRMGMMRAVRRVGSESIEDIVGGYRSRTFGFASSNFFVELLASIEVEKNAEKYFGKVDRAPAMVAMEAELPDAVNLKELVRFMKLDMGALRELNPGLASQVFTGSRLVPAGYLLRLPLDRTLEKDGAIRVFLAGFSQIPEMYKRKGHRSKIYDRSRSQR